jgi:hypothetical protein
MRIRIAAIALLGLVAWMPVHANDSMGYLAVGGLVLKQTADIEMRSEDLYVSEKEIRVRYHFFNTSTSDIKTLVAFPIPDLPPLMDNEYALPAPGSANFLSFETKVDGKPVTNSIEQRAVLNGTDYTDLLKSLNVPLLFTQEATGKALNALNSEQQKKLQELGLVHDEEYDVGHGMEKHLTPNWTLQTAFHWEQVFPAGKELTVEHRYQPFVGGNVGYLVSGEGKFQEEILTQYKTRYCVDDEFLNAVQRAKKAVGADNLVAETQLEYVLVTGANWAGPIQDFRLVIDKGKPSNLVSFCASGVKKIAPTQFEVHYKNYTPDRNLQVLIMQGQP